MRIRVSGRFIVLAMLATVLCFLPAITQIAHARPIGWDDPTTKQGDSDGVVLKASSFQMKGEITAPTTGSTGSSATRLTVRSTDRQVYRGLRELFAAMRMGYFRLFWVR